MENNDLSAGWSSFERGTTEGQRGSEGGVILRDEEHLLGARISLERLQGQLAKYAITCGMYGWFLHTRFFGGEDEARGDFEEMKAELSRMLALLDSGMGEKQMEHEVLEAISNFVDRFPT
jgi:hypothetical protein